MSDTQQTTHEAIVNRAPFRLAKSETLPLTRDELEKFRALPGSVTERDLIDSHVRKLGDKFRAGTAITFSWASAILDDKEIRVNGQHSSEALTGLNGSFPEGLTVHRDTYEVDDEQGLVLLFRQFDDRISGRTPVDVAGAYMKLEPDLEGLNLRVAKLGVEAVAWYDDHIVGSRKVLGDDRYSAFHEPALHSFLQWQDGLFSVKTPELFHVPIIASVWATWQAHQEESKVFWDIVARGGTPGDDGHPAAMLDEQLKQMQAKTIDRPKGKALYAGCVYAWNCYRAGTQPRTIRFDGKKGIPEVNE